MAPLSEIMTTELVTVSPDLTLQEVARVFAASGITGAPVVSGRELVGVVSSTDIVEFETTNPGSPRQREERSEWGEIDTLPVLDGSEEAEPGLYFTEMWDDAGADVLARFESDSPEWNRLAEATVGSVMTTSVVSLLPGSAVQEAARIMALADVHRILVVDESGELVGLVSSTDIVKAVADRGLAGA
jgi:CBS domain-containing protein